MVRLWLPAAAVMFAVLLHSCEPVFAGETTRPHLPPLTEAVDVRPLPSGLTVLVFAHDLQAAYQTVPSEPSPVCTRVVVVERNEYYLADRNGGVCVYRIVPEPVMWRASGDAPFAPWIEKTFHPLTLK